MIMQAGAVLEVDEMTRRFCELLESCEMQPREDVMAYRLALLEGLCRHARTTTEFYRHRLDCLFDSNDHFRFEHWDEVPILKRQEIADNFEALQSMHLPDHLGNLKMASSSGSSGQPVKVLWTDTQVTVTACIGARLHRWHNVDPAEFLVLVYVAPANVGFDETVHEAWAPVYQSLGIRGRCVNLNGQHSLEHIIQRLETLQPQHLNINPRLLFAIANEYLSRGSRPGYVLNSVGTFGETRTKTIDDRIEQVFGVRPYSRYTADEVGHIAVECPDCGAYHVAEEVVQVDVVDSRDQTVPPGTSGRILSTPLYSHAMPLIRYELGDVVRTIKSDCRRAKNITLQEIEGRLGDLFYHPDGYRFRPNRAVLMETYEHLDAAAAQVVQTAPDRLTVRYQPRSSPATKSSELAMAKALQGSLGFNAIVTFEPVAQIPVRSGNGKREDFICEVEPDSSC